MSDTLSWPSVPLPSWSILPDILINSSALAKISGCQYETDTGHIQTISKLQHRTEKPNVTLKGPEIYVATSKLTDSPLEEGLKPFDFTLNGTAFKAVGIREYFGTNTPIDMDLYKGDLSMYFHKADKPSVSSPTVQSNLREAIRAALRSNIGIQNIIDIFNEENIELVHNE